MRFENIAIIFSLIFIFMVACTSMKQINTADSCILFDSKKSWYKSTKKVMISGAHLLLFN